MKKILLKDFQKLDFRVGTVIAAEKIRKSQNLLRIEIDLGKEKRQIIAGINEQYQPEDLVDQQIVIIANLEPKAIFGLESQGMLLAINDETIALIQPDKKVKPGAKIC